MQNNAHLNRYVVHTAVKLPDEKEYKYYADPVFAYSAHDAITIIHSQFSYRVAMGKYDKYYIQEIKCEPEPEQEKKPEEEIKPEPKTKHKKKTKHLKVVK